MLISFFAKHLTHNNKCSINEHFKLQLTLTTWELGTLSCIIENLYITLQSALHTHGSASLDSTTMDHVVLWYVYIEKKMFVSGSMQFKLVFSRVSYICRYSELVKESFLIEK